MDCTGVVLYFGIRGGGGGGGGGGGEGGGGECGGGGGRSGAGVGVCCEASSVLCEMGGEIFCDVLA